MGLGAYICITRMTISFCSGSKHLVVWCVHGEPLTAFYLTRSPKGNDRSSESQVRGNKLNDQSYTHRCVNPIYLFSSSLYLPQTHFTLTDDASIPYLFCDCQRLLKGTSSIIRFLLMFVNFYGLLQFVCISLMKSKHRLFKLSDVPKQ